MTKIRKGRGWYARKYRATADRSRISAKLRYNIGTYERILANGAAHRVGMCHVRF